MGRLTPIEEDQQPQCSTSKAVTVTKHHEASTDSNGNNKRNGNSDESGFYDDEVSGSNPVPSTSNPVANRCATRDDSVEIVYDRRQEKNNNNGGGSSSIENLKQQAAAVMNHSR